jgi:hypothetical protein
VRDLAAEDRHLDHSGEIQIGDERPAAGDQPVVLHPGHAGSDEVRSPRESWSVHWNNAGC